MIPIAGRSKTVENVYRAVFAFSRWLEGHDLADDVTTVRADDIRGWLASLRGKVSPSTEYPSYCRCRQCLAWWVRDSELENLPESDIPGPSHSRPVDAVRTGKRRVRLGSRPSVRRVVRVGVVATQALPIVDVVGERLVVPGRLLDLVLRTVNEHLLLGCVDPLDKTAGNITARPKSHDPISTSRYAGMLSWAASTRPRSPSTPTTV